MWERAIPTKDRLTAIHDGREGLVFNTDGKKLHAAGCAWVASMGLGTRKLHFAIWSEAKRELDSFYGQEGSAWIRCPTCADNPIFEGGHAMPTHAVAPVAVPTVRAGRQAPRRAKRPRPRVGRQPVLHAFAEELDARPGVYLWCSEYIDYDDPPRPEDLEAVAQGLRARLRVLQPGDDQLLHAIYAGPKGPKTDVENNLFYNVHTGRDALRGATNGVRFEWWPDPPVGALRGYQCRYAYRLVASDERFSHWRPERSLSHWPSIDLGPLSGEKKLELVWHALRTSKLVAPRWPARRPRERFGLCLDLLVPPGRASVSASFIKSVLDGIVCAFQHEPNRAMAETVARRVAEILKGAGVVLGPSDVVELLAGDERSVLGPRPGLRTRTQWQPHDEHCVAVELRFGTSTGVDYRLSGEVFTVLPASPAFETTSNVARS